jgi:hypothetical protein
MSGFLGPESRFGHKGRFWISKVMKQKIHSDKKVMNDRGEELQLHTVPQVSAGILSRISTV